MNIQLCLQLNFFMVQFHAVNVPEDPESFPFSQIINTYNEKNQKKDGKRNNYEREFEVSHHLKLNDQQFLAIPV